ncbi:MAG: beta-hydroxyacyl-ACP dehydratase [Gemmatimonadetes bacterium]|nr:beta-hydroxyacyl-ACP dehydratase [Gemmatimonadota bacterium]
MTSVAEPERPDVRRARRVPIADLASVTPTSVDREGIERLIPHRAPFLLIDRLTHCEPARGLIAGERAVAVDDPVFRGHFPGEPVYPGSLQIEAAGQLALCLEGLLASTTTDGGPRQVRAIGVREARFVFPVRPGDTLTLIAQRLGHDDLMASALVQTLVGTRVCAVALIECVFIPKPAAGSAA